MSKCLGFALISALARMCDRAGANRDSVVLCCRNTEVTYVYQGHSATGSLRLAPVSPEQGMK